MSAPEQEHPPRVGDRSQHELPAVEGRALQLVDRRKASGERRHARITRRALVLSDVAGLTLAFLVPRLLLESGGPLERIGLTMLLGFAATLPAWILALKLYGLYNRNVGRTDNSAVDEVVAIFHLLTVGSWLLFAAAQLSSWARPNLGELALFWVLAIAFVTLGRSVVRTVSRHRRGVQNAVIVGAGDVGQLIARRFLVHPEERVSVIGFVDREPPELDDGVGHLPLLGRPEQLPALVRLFDIDRVVLAFWNDTEEQTIELVRALHKLDVEIDVATRLFEVIGPTVGIHTVEGFPLIGLTSRRASCSSRAIKRAIDVSVASLGLMVFAPLILLVAIRIKLDSPGPVFFRQARIGVGNQRFLVYKFRTMTCDAEERKLDLAHLNRHAQNGNQGRMFKVPHDPRVTRFGRFLRRYFLDELPQLLNVLKGEMSLVGPRPLIPDEDRHVVQWARRRLDFKPGMTGVWQVLGNSAIPFEEMVKLDYLYVATWSLGNDLRLLCRTVPVVLRGGGGAY